MPHGANFSENFYLNSIRDNYTKASTVAEYHYQALVKAASGGDADFILMRDDFKPLRDGVAATTSAKVSSYGHRVGATRSQDDLLAGLQKQFEVWLPSIQGVYAKSSPQYKVFFPLGLDVFYSGPIQSRIDKLGTLATDLIADGHAVISGTGALVDAYHTLLVNAHGAQAGEKGAVNTGIGSAQAAIDAMAVGHFVNHGRLIAKFPKEPAKIAAFTDWVTLYSHAHSVEYVGTLHGGELKKALAHKFTEVSTIVVNNTGAAQFGLYVAEHAKDKVHLKPIIVPVGVTKMVIEVKKLGDTGHRILMIQNLDPVTEGAYEIFVGNNHEGVITDPHD